LYYLKKPHRNILRINSRGIVEINSKKVLNEMVEIEVRDERVEEDGRKEM